MKEANAWSVAWGPAQENCPCCNGPLAAFVRSPDRFFGGLEVYDLVRCRECASILLVVGPAWDMAQVYPSGYYAYRKAEQVSVFHRLMASYFFPLPIRPVPSGTIVDFGCGTGLLVEFLAGQYQDVCGVEFSREAVEAGLQVGRRLTCQAWEEWEPGDGSVSVLIMNQVIEHLPQEPRTVFSKVARILKPGGQWVIRTPNAASKGNRRFGAFWHPLEVPRHTLIYSPKGITALAKPAGFEVVKSRFCGRAFDIKQSCRYVKSATAQKTELPRQFPLSFPLVPQIMAHLWNLREVGDSFEIVLRKPHP